MHGDDDLDLVAQALLEGRAQRAVDQAAGEDRVLAGTALAAEERAGDLARGVHPLLDVDRQREEVELVLGVLAGRGGRQQHGLVVEVGGDGAGGLPGQQAGLEADGAGAELAVVDDGLDGVRCSGPSVIGCLLSSSRSDPRAGVRDARRRAGAGLRSRPAGRR